MLHPFQSIPDNTLMQVLLPLLALTSLLTLVLLAIPLKPSIVQFEFNAREVIKSWHEIDKRWAAFSLGLDFLYLVVYSTTISLACVLAANVIQAYSLLLATLGIWLAWGQWLAALLDAVENTALVRVLFSDEMNFSPKIAKWWAIFKFCLIALGLLYVGMGGVFWIAVNFFQA